MKLVVPDLCRGLVLVALHERYRAQAGLWVRPLSDEDVVKVTGEEMLRVLEKVNSTIH